jgi:hypothetical protein
MSIHSFLVETPTRRIVVDTGMGNDKPRGRPEWNVPWSRPNCRERLRLAACELARQGSRSRCWPTTRPTFHRRRSQQSEDIDLK